MTVDIRPYSQEDLPAVVAWWNRAFVGCRNFFPVSEQTFERRVTGHAGATEEFVPANLLLAREEATVVGAVHVGVRSEEWCRLVLPGWKGGSQAYIALLAVEPDRRRCGIGARLFEEAGKATGGNGPLAIDGQCLNPWYGNSGAPFTPFWGTTEGISVPWDDTATRRFFEKRGHAPRFRAITLEAPLRATGPWEGWMAEATGRGYRLDAVASRMPELGCLVEHAKHLACETPFEAAVAHREGIVCARAVGYRMVPMDATRYGVYEVNVASNLRGQGLGSAALAALLQNAAQQGAKVAEALTVPDLSPGGMEMYARLGFRETTSWAVY